MNYVIERLGDISGETFHSTLEDAFEQLEKEYPKESDYYKRLKEIIGNEKKTKEVVDYLFKELKIVNYLPDRITPDPEDDRILIWGILPCGHKKVVWHFSGWHWVNDASDVVEGGLIQGSLPNDERCLYTIACED